MPSILVASPTPLSLQAIINPFIHTQKLVLKTWTSSLQSIGHRTSLVRRSIRFKERRKILGKRSFLFCILKIINDLLSHSSFLLYFSFLSFFFCIKMSRFFPSNFARIKSFDSRHGIPANYFLFITRFISVNVSRARNLKEEKRCGN